ncbi:A/G-specific adenine glycosylase [Macrococcus hajekii]|uniref:Adenine DNA glycosylase n=1 Tax=Macrococcus hajekii TaxID=198482 RepID=A0A4V3BE59_9STAP|nr:A/G-specific adenine glycosylase [Macrococcus hajekii]TDM01274.1 A/G-specific adenine glycosylase [Macrococcus hajekii]GGB10252.1 A/G-specific adenine glycosylase [Macrococcus hajekii]
MKERETFAENLLSWFDVNKREMPWRETKDPYKIWLSEVMLQQTQVNTVRSYYLKFIERFPTIETLAEADEDEVLKYWEGLGYYSRVRNFQSAVREVAETYGSVPDDGEQFLALKGVGPYTRGAVMSIAFNQPYPAVDGNVFRVFSRLDDDATDTAKPSARKHFENKVMQVIPERAGDFNEALMELGATVCTPRNPICMLCPVNMHCEAFEAGTVLERPVKIKKMTRKELRYKVMLIINDKGELLITQRPKTGLLGGMWQFPMFDEDMPMEDIEAVLDMKLMDKKEKFHTVTHGFTHLDWILDVYIARTTDQPGHDFQFIAENEKENYTFPVSMSKIFSHYQQVK